MVFHTRNLSLQEITKNKFDSLKIIENRKTLSVIDIGYAEFLAQELRLGNKKDKLGLYEGYIHFWPDNLC